jgi:hypothetical protein
MDFLPIFFGVWLRLLVLKDVREKEEEASPLADVRRLGVVA